MAAAAPREGDPDARERWEACLGDLVGSPVVCGAAVVGARGGRTAFACGELAEGVPPAAVQALDAAFAALAGGKDEAEALGGVPPIECCGGRRFVPLRLGFTGLYATSRHRRASLGVARLPFGYLVAVCGRPHRLEALVPLLERVADRFRA